jgi:hypothetical protein
MAGSSCYIIYAQLQRINDSAELARSSHLPFDMPPQCDPRRHNISLIYGNGYCSIECRNNGTLGGMGRCGEMDASYGPGNERIGVGWRY